jgi:predicted aconitase with swiveling domain
MAKKTFKGRPLLPGKLEGEALVSHPGFNASGSYLDHMFGGKTAPPAICTDSNNEDLAGKDLSGSILCTPQVVGSTLGGCVMMGMDEMKVGPKAILMSLHIDSVSASGVFMNDIWYGRRIITIDLLGDEFLEAVNTGDPIAIHEDGTVEVG